MELEQIRKKWQTGTAPTYSREEVESIFQIKQSNVLGSFKSLLQIDLIIANLIAIGFIITLQILDLRTSNFWSAVMAFVSVQHFFIYRLQTFLIRIMSRFSGSIVDSIESSIKKLEVIRWLYRILPSFLGSSLYIAFISRVELPLSNSEFILIGLGIATFILIISETLSSVLVKSHLQKLKMLKVNLEEIT